MRARGVRLPLLALGAEIPGAPSACLEDESLSCAECGAILYLSGASAPSHPQRPVCLRHAPRLPCASAEIVAWQRFGDEELRRLTACNDAVRGQAV